MIISFASKIAEDNVKNAMGIHVLNAMLDSMLPMENVNLLVVKHRAISVLKEHSRTLMQIAKRFVLLVNQIVLYVQMQLHA